MPPASYKTRKLMKYLVEEMSLSRDWPPERLSSLFKCQKERSEALDSILTDMLNMKPTMKQMTRLKKLGFGDSAMKRITNARVAYDLSRAKYAQKTGKLM